MATIPGDDAVTAAMRAGQAGDHLAALALWDRCPEGWPARAGRVGCLAFARTLLAINRPRRAEDAFLPPQAASVLAMLREDWPEEPLGWIGAAKLAEWRHDPREACRLWRDLLDRFDALAEPDWYEQFMAMAWLCFDRDLFTSLRAMLRARWPAHETQWDRQDGRRRRGTATERQPDIRLVEDVLRFGTPAEAKVILERLPAHDQESASGRACAQIIRSIEHGDLLQNLTAGGVDLARPATSLVWRNPAGSDRVLIVFAGGGRGFWLLVDELHRVLRHCGAHVIYMRDFGGSYYLAGDPDLGILDYRGMLALLRGQVAGLGATRLACIGNSAGGHAAVRYALDLGAEAALAFSMQANAESLHARHLAPVFQAVAERNPGFAFDLAEAYAAAPRTPRLILGFGAGHERDRTEAERMRGLPGVRLEPAEGFAGHGAVRWFLQQGRLPGLVAALFGDAAP